MKYRLGDKHDKDNLYRVVAVKSFGNVKAGDIGGYIETTRNLSQYGNAWVYGHAQVYDNALVYGDACVFGNALVSGDACVFGNALVSGNAWVFGNARVSGNARVYGNAQVYGDAQVSGLEINYTPVGISGLKYPITILRGHIQAGCYLKTIKEWEMLTQFEDQEFMDEWKNKILALAR